MAERSDRLIVRKAPVFLRKWGLFLFFHAGGTNFACAAEKNKCIQCFFGNTLDFGKKVIIIVKHREHLGIF